MASLPFWKPLWIAWLQGGSSLCLVQLPPLILPCIEISLAYMCFLTLCRSDWCACAPERARSHPQGRLCLWNSCSLSWRCDNGPGHAQHQPRSCGQSQYGSRPQGRPSYHHIILTPSAMQPSLHSSPSFSLLAVELAVTMASLLEPARTMLCPSQSSLMRPLPWRCTSTTPSPPSKWMMSASGFL